MKTQKFEAVFFDRDGTLGDNSDVEFPQDFRPFPYVADVFDAVKSRGIKVFIFTNQACIARKKDGGYDFAAEFASYGADDWFVCPHDNADNCDCRKPKAGLLLAAREKYGLDLRRCLAAGDRWTDVEAGVSAGAKTALVLTGRGKDCLADNPKRLKPDYVCGDIRDIARLLTR